MSDFLRQVVATVDEMTPISLAEIKVLALSDRLDVKFILHDHQLAQILERVRDKYRVGDQRCAPWSSPYTLL